MAAATGTGCDGVGEAQGSIQMLCTSVQGHNSWAEE